MLHLQTLHNHLNLTDAFNIAVFAAACIAFWSCFHLGELLIDSAFDPALHISQSTKFKQGIASNNYCYISFHIPHTKTKPSGDDIHLTDSSCSCSPVTAFLHHLHSNTNILDETPLFSFETAAWSWSPLLCSWFMDHCNAIWSSAGLGSVKGHRFWIGGATFLLMLGINPRAMELSSISYILETMWRDFASIHWSWIESHTSILSTMTCFKEHLLAN